MKMCFYAPLATGGVYAYFSALREALRPFDWDVVAVAAGSDAAGRADPALMRGRGEIIAPREADPVRALIELTEWVADTRVDVFHSFGTEELGDRALRCIPRSSRTMVSIHANSWGAVLQGATHAPYANAVVALSRIQAHRLIAGGVPPDRLAIIPHGVLNRALPREPGRDGVPTIAYVGFLRRRTKGIDLVPRVARQLKSNGHKFTWSVYGCGPDREALLRDIDRWGVADCVQYRGALSPTAVPEVLAATDILVVPSRTESFCYSLAEGMDAGCCVVATRLPGVTDKLVEHNKTGLLVSSGDVAAFADAITVVLADASRREQLAAAAQAFVRTRYSLAAMGSRYAALLSDCRDRCDKRPVVTTAASAAGARLRPTLWDRACALWRSAAAPTSLVCSSRYDHG